MPARIKVPKTAMLMMSQTEGLASENSRDLPEMLLYNGTNNDAKTSASNAAITKMISVSTTNCVSKCH